MRRFICGWKELGYEARFQSKIVNYADDLVICCREGYAAKNAGLTRSRFIAQAAQEAIQAARRT